MASLPSPAELQWQELHAKDNAVPSIVAANVAGFSLACIAVVLRFVARRVAKIKYQIDDWLIIVGLVIFPLSHKVASLDVICILFGAW